MLKNKLLVFIVLALALNLFTVSVFAARGSQAQVSISFEKDVFLYQDSILIKVSITNTGKQPITILRWYTPLDGVKDDLFSVSIDGKAVEYIGPHYKRPAPTAADYITLGSGETVGATIDLAGYYDLSATGYYQVSYNVAAFDIFSRTPAFSAEEDRLSSKDVSAWIEGRETKMPAPAIVNDVVGSTGFTGCTSIRQSSLLTARNNAYTYSTNAYNYLSGGTVGPRYATWFGAYTSSRYNTVRGNFSSIQNAMNNASVVFNCTCTDSAYAYVYSNQPYTIYLCNAFWNAPSTGTDSKAGTLVHEMSHFNVVAGTNDYAYGQTAAKKLANKTPNKAIDNADSHEYFAENTPAQN
ncbi:MAG TPA: M35 family metallo-endopeptidase [Pyrinomonadaceae bacterium]|nr:M35 family metallo-endopeptidase [Pyrinomonadaceae bacterium]